MKVRQFIISISFILIAIYSCKKNDGKSADDPNLLVNGEMSPQLGKKINLSKYGNIPKNQCWGRNADELFVSTGSNGTLRLQFSINTIQTLEGSGGLIVGRTNENSAVIIATSINGANGIYTYSYSNGMLEKILSIPMQTGIRINIAENHMLYYSALFGPPTNPCTSPWDFWCSNSPSVISSSFVYIEKTSRQAVALEKKSFECFSKDSRYTLLSDRTNSLKYYIFNNQLKSLTDSIDLSQQNPYSSFKTFFYDDVIKIADVETGTGNNDKIVIRNASTGQVIDSYISTAKFVGIVNWSADGTKLFYTGGTGLNSNTSMINVYDLITKQEKTVGTYSLGATPVYISDLQLSPDNKRIVLRYFNDLYVKDI
jgi:hypothetical protein